VVTTTILQPDLKSPAVTFTARILGKFVEGIPRVLFIELTSWVCTILVLLYTHAVSNRVVVIELQYVM